jgi:rhodanese-related sulfurtransferase
MGVKQVDSIAAHARLVEAPSAVYLDVRTEEEFARGHPKGAINVPLVFLQTADQPARPNPTFLEDVARVLDRNAEVFVGCQVGGRSQRACEILAAAGFTNLANVQGGFGGSRDRAGNLLVPGWLASGLPVETGQPDGRSYAMLKKHP